eukprot:gnl/Chilomastix_caulleri/1465.p1 GENE.gnl/Chilomastix_caulleri/1465~~gnl/Chilomastix_caulleri/1465.p1  ORF type:complete len:304 (+),score=75.82 gnl/Chilomastix_caulleri/1465:30-941(+)
MKLEKDSIVIGWIGTGVMGSPMCGHILNAGYRVVVYNRSASKTQGLVEKGAEIAKSPREVAELCDVIFTMVGYPSDVEEVYFGSNGIFEGSKEGSKIFIDMTTTKPNLAIRINERAKELKCDSLDAPVSGGDVGAREARLSIMVGGEEETFNEVIQLFQLLGPSIMLEGPAGSGQHTKMSNQIVIAGTMIGVCESLLYAKKAGLDLTLMVETISKGAAGCWTLNNLAPRVIRGDYNPGFFVDHFVKDMGIALEEAARMKISLPGLALVHQLYVSLQGQGKGLKGTQSLITALDRLSSCGMFVE